MSRNGIERYDAIVIGSGQAGKPLAVDLAKAGWRTAIIEREHVGGTCVNVGCTPTKTMVASARIAHLAQRAQDYGVTTGSLSLDMGRVRERKRDIVDRFRGGIERRFESTDGLELMRGEGRFAGPHEVEVEGNGALRRLRAGHVFINTGCRPVAPLEGVTGLPVLDSTSIMELGEIPEHLVVLGGGYIGVEFGQMFGRFGSRVTIVQRGEHLLAREDPDVADAVAEILRDEGVELMFEAEAQHIEASESGARLTVQQGGREQTLCCSHVLAAAGRRPNTDRLGLESAGIGSDRNGYVQVDAKLQTAVPGVYALGDVKGGPAFTHIAYDDYRVVRANLLEGGDATVEGRMVPYAVFMDPELARVGMSETEARAAGRDIRVAKLPMANVARALEMDETRGFMKAVVDAHTGEILGCTILGVFGGEIMSILQVAMMGKLPYSRIKEGIFAHPTMAESLNNLFLAMDAG